DALAWRTGIRAADAACTAGAAADPVRRRAEAARTYATRAFGTGPARLPGAGPAAGALGRHGTRCTGVRAPGAASGYGAVGVAGAGLTRQVVARVAETLERTVARRGAVRARRRDRAGLRTRRVGEVDRQRRNDRCRVDRAVEARAAPEEIRRRTVDVAREAGVRADVARSPAHAVVRRRVADALRTR